jgi:alkylhydroperoxidase family enzyme
VLRQPPPAPRCIEALEQACRHGLLRAKREEIELLLRKFRSIGYCRDDFRQIGSGFLKLKLMEAPTMAEFTLHSLESAPEASRSFLLQARSEDGSLRNMYRMLAESPVALDAYKRLTEAFAESSLTPLEQRVVYLTAAHKNQCHYCTSVEPAFGAGDATAIARAILEEKAIPDRRLQALRSFTASLVDQRGWVSEGMVDMFLDAGFDRAHILEVITGIALVTIGSYANHIAATPIDHEVLGTQQLAS